MKRILVLLGLAVLLPQAIFAREQSILARVTVYWASGGGGSDRWTRRHICSTGARLQAGHCAVDPRRIPYGSNVTLPDGTLRRVLMVDLVWFSSFFSLLSLADLPPSVMPNSQA